MSGLKRPGQPGRHKGHVIASDLIPLGSKGGTTRQASPNPSAPPAKKPHLQLQQEDSSSSGTASGGGLFTDPIRITQSTGAGGSASKSLGGGAASSKSTPPPSTIPPIEVRPADLVAAVKEALTANNTVKAEKLLCGALKQLKNARLKVDTVLNSALTTIALQHTELLSSASVIEGLVTVLKKESSAIYKTRKEPITYALACQLLLVALSDSYSWPESVAKVYIEDAFGDRVWAEFGACKKLIDNINTIFDTRSSSGGGQGQVGVAKSSELGTQLVGLSETKGEDISEDAEEMEEEKGRGSGLELFLQTVEVAPRFSMKVCHSLHTQVHQLITEQLGRRAPPTSEALFRNQLKFLTVAAGLPEVRLLVAQHFEQWVQNTKMTKLLHELLSAVAINCHNHTEEDVKVIEILVGLRLKTRLFSTQYISCIKELIGSHPDNLSTSLKTVVHNELTQSTRGSPNMTLLTMMVHSWPEEAALLLGEVFQNFLAHKEDYLRALRVFLRELVRQVKVDLFPFTSFTRALMQERKESTFSSLDHASKERIALSLADLISCCCMLTANILIREAFAGYAKGEKAMISQLKEFFETLGIIQRDAVWWVHTVLPTFLRPQPASYKTCLRKVLFLEPAESYTGKDSWPPDSDRQQILPLMYETSLQGDTLLRVLVIGLTRELPLPPSDALDIADKLVARAANTHTSGIPKLPSLERKELFNAVFDITSYRPPASIQLPSDYTPPDLAISKLYWKGWILLLVLSAYNPTTIGSVGWNEYPTLRAMMEMVTTNNYTFPSSMTLAVTPDGVMETADSAIAHEVQLSRIEKESILEYENHLASSSHQSAVITESNSYLLNQVTLRDPKGPARRLIPSVIELVKTVNKSLKLGQLLCQCREPDFLLSIIQRQGTERSMGWLKDLVEGSAHSSLEALPVPCLCEFLISSYQEMWWVGPDSDHAPSSSNRTQHKRKQKMKEKTLQQHQQLVERLRTMLMDASSSSSITLDVLHFFLEKLTHPQLTSRHLALRALKEILTSPTTSSSATSSTHLFSDTEEEDSAFSSAVSVVTNPLSWLLDAIPSLPQFFSLSSSISALIGRACQVETTLLLFLGYLIFLTTHAKGDSMGDLIIELSSTIVRRFAIIKKILRTQCTSVAQPVATISELLSMLRSVLDQFLYQGRLVPESVAEQDIVLVVFPAAGVGEVSLPHSLLEAILLLLPLVPCSQCSSYLTELFFPSDQLLPRVVSLTTKEPLPLVSERIWGHVLCSSNSALTSGVVKYLTPPQLCRTIQLSGISHESVEIVLEELDRLSATPVLFREGMRDMATLTECVCARMVKERKNGVGSKFLTYLQSQLGSSPSRPPSLSELLSPSLPPLLSPCPKTRSAPLSLSLPRSPSLDVTKQLIISCFSTTSSSSETSTRKLVTFLQKSLSGNHGNFSDTLKFTVITIHQLVAYEPKETVLAFARNPSSPLLVSFLIKFARQHQSVLQPLKLAITALLSSVSEKNVPLLFSAALKSCKQQLEREEVGRKNQSAILCDLKETKIDKVLVLCSEMVKSGSVMVEEVMVKIARKAVTEGKEKEAFQLLTTLYTTLPSSPLSSSFAELPTNDIHEPMDYSSGDCAPQLSIQGLVCDLLEVLDPNLLQLCLSDGQKVIFGGGEGEKVIIPYQQSYLLGRVVHQSSWHVVRETITALLNPQWCSIQNKSLVIPGAVLDMLWACLHSPSLWQGRVKKEAVINSNLSLGIDEQSHLVLTPSQLTCLLDYVLDEAAQVTNDDAVDDVIFSRLPLVVSCCNHGNDLSVACKHLLEQTDKRSSLSWLLLVQLYHTDQRVANMVGSRSQRLMRASLASPLPTRVDTQLHHLLSTMMSSTPDKDCVRKMTAASLLCRHIAITHPSLLLRHLSMLGWLLRGRVHLTPKQFQLNNHQHVFNNVFHLLELLQPVIFETDEALNSCLEPLFDFLQQQCLDHQKSHTLVVKMSTFLLQYLYHNRQPATTLITRHVSTLRGLAEVLPKHKSALQPIIDSVPLINSSSDEGSQKSLDPLLSGGPAILLSPATGQQHSYQQLLPFLKKLEHGQSQESISRVLRDLDDSSLRSVDILKHFVPELCRLIQDPTHSSKALSHDLLLRHLRHHPSTVEEVLPSLLSCLESHDHSVVMAAVSSVCDIALLCKASHASLLLTKLFKLSLHPSLNCSPELIKTVNSFMIQLFA